MIEKTQLETGDMVMSRMYKNPLTGVEMVECVTIVFEDGLAVDEEVAHFTLEAFNEAMLEKQNENKQYVTP